MNESTQQIHEALARRIGESVFGMENVARALTIGLIARGHILLEGVPGLGKTLLSKTLAGQLGGTFRRIQCTADLMPSDIIGVHIYNSKTREFVFNQGPLFADVVLVDEINRTGPKTQSALLEAMEERQVSVERETFTLPENFLVIATQNPREFEGTYPLPESQLDRFLLQINMDYPQREHEREVLARYGKPQTGHDQMRDVADVLDQAMLEKARSEVSSIEVADELRDYVLDIADATRRNEQISLGLSSRGALALLRCASVEAAIRGSGFVTPDDVKAVAPLVLIHRLILTPDAMLEGADSVSMVEILLNQVNVPR